MKRTGIAHLDMRTLCDPHHLPFSSDQLLSLRLNQSLLLGSIDRPYAHFPFPVRKQKRKQVYQCPTGVRRPFSLLLYLSLRSSLTHRGRGFRGRVSCSSRTQQGASGQEEMGRGGRRRRRASREFPPPVCA